MTTLDTSGVVRADIPGMISPVSWPDLSPFAQGYVEAPFESVGGALPRDIDHLRGDFVLVAFSDLAPEALAMILRDCEAWLAEYPDPMRHLPQRATGRTFWEIRQAGRRKTFPPLCVYLNDAGKVMLEVAK